MVEDAVQYLTDAEDTDAPESDVETRPRDQDQESLMSDYSRTDSEMSGNYGKLKHSDSLLLLHQVPTPKPKIMASTHIKLY